MNQPTVLRHLKSNEIAIEGVDVSRGRPFAGFRGPTLDNGRAAILSVALDALFGDKPADPRRSTCHSETARRCSILNRLAARS
jgi:hypothetical protein